MVKFRKKSNVFLSLFIIMALGITMLMPVRAEAATNKALMISYSFNGQSYEKDGDDCGYNNNYGIFSFGTSKKTVIKNLKMNVDLYVPKAALKENGSIINLNAYLDIVDSKGKYIGYLPGKINLSAVNENGKIKLYAWDEEQQKNTKASVYGSCKAGKGKYKSYYVIKLKKAPFIPQIIDEKDEKITLGAKDKYAFNMGINVAGENIKGSGKLYVDNMKTTSGSKTVINQNFTKKPEFVGSFNKDKDLPKSKIKIVKF